MSRDGERLLTPQFLTVTAAGTLYFLGLGVVLPVIPVYVDKHLRGGTIAVGVAAQLLELTQP